MVRPSEDGRLRDCRMGSKCEREEERRGRMGGGILCMVRMERRVS